MSALIIDDSKLDRMMSAAVIKKNLFAKQIVSCHSVSEGLTYLQSLIREPESLPEVIFLDVNMPGMDGFDFLDSFLKFPLEVQKSCTIFMVSATNSLEELERIKTYKVVRKFYNKPLTFDILKNIRACMGIDKHASRKQDGDRPKDDNHAHRNV